MNLSQSMNMTNKEMDNAYVIENVSANVNAYETLCLICAELDVNLKEVSDSDFDSCSMILDDFLKNNVGNTVSVWFH